MKIHHGRAMRLAELSSLDPDTQWPEIYRRTVLWEFPAEARLGFQLAFYRPLAVPGMAATFHKSGHLERNATRRAYDTGIVIHEIIYNGVDSHRGRKMVRLMNSLHDQVGVQQEDLTYVLNALIVVPSRYIARAGWRPLTHSERVATWRFWIELGKSMAIDDLPGSFHEAELSFDSFEARHLAPSPEGQMLTKAVLDALRHRMPRPLRPITPHITSALIDDARLCAALNLPSPNPALASTLNIALAARRIVQRVSPPPSQPSFHPGQPAGTVYPHGYVLDQLGPHGK
jgi:hypothetical protein